MKPSNFAAAILPSDKVYRYPSNTYDLRTDLNETLEALYDTIHDTLYNEAQDGPPELA